MKKKLVSLLMAALFLVGITPAYAADIRAESVEVMSLNEFEYIEEMQSHSKAELVESGLTVDEAEEILAFDYKEALYERAQLSEAQLAALGYTEAQIKGLKEFEANPDGEYNFVALAATLTGTITRNAGSYNSRKITYSWTWSAMPLAAFEDRVGVRWQGVDTNGNNTVDLTCGSGTANRSSIVNYYDTSTGYLATSITTTSISYDSINKSLVIQFPMSGTHSGLTTWAKSGSLTCYITTVSQILHYVNFQATYGHKTFAGSISISYSSGFGIGFTPTTIIENYSKAAKVYETYMVNQ